MKLDTAFEMTFFHEEMDKGFAQNQNSNSFI